MKSRGARLILVVGLIAAVVVVLSPIVRRSADTPPVTGGQGPLVISLAPPAFAQLATLSFPMNEAGISAYVSLNATIDLAKARGLLSAVEDATDTYVIGTVALTGNSEDMWPHVYIGKDGWLLAYYPKTEPTSKLVQWYGYTRDAINTTTLRDTLISLARSLSLDISKMDAGLTYFHFQYPDATKLLIAVDTEAGSDEFRYTVPSGVILYDAAWSHYSSATLRSNSSIDGTYICSRGDGNNYATYISCDKVGGQFLTPGVAHNVAITCSYGWVGLALVFLYR